MAAADFLIFLETQEGNHVVELNISAANFDTEKSLSATIYLPVRTVRKFLERHSVHPCTQYILQVKEWDPTRKRGYREDLALFTKEQLLEAKVDLDKLIGENKVYIDQQMVRIKNHCDYIHGDKLASVFDLQNLMSQAR